MTLGRSESALEQLRSSYEDQLETLRNAQGPLEKRGQELQQQLLLSQQEVQLLQRHLMEAQEGRRSQQRQAELQVTRLDACWRRRWPNSSPRS